MSAAEEIMPVEPDRVVVESVADGMSLTQLDTSDAPTLLALAQTSRDHLRQFRGIVAASLETVREFEEWIKGLKDMDILGLGIRDEGQLVGCITLMPDEGTGDGAVGYWVGREHLGHHYATRALYMVMQHAFSNIGLASLSAEVKETNVYSARSLEAAGFDYTGKLYDAWQYEYLNPEKNHVAIKKEREVDENFSMAEIELEGAPPRTINRTSNAKFVVLRGKVFVDIDDQAKRYDQGEPVSVPAKTAYRMATVGGPAVLWALHTPPFSPKDQEIVKLRR